VIGLKDHVGQKISTWIRPNGLEINKVRVPIGVIGIIYESRPNVTADAAVLCIKSSNTVILKGGKEALHSNRAIATALQEGGEKKGLPANAIQLIKTTDRSAVTALVRLNDYVDLVIPRGGEGLIHAVTVQATVPVIKHYKGVCHVYVDEFADLDMAVDIIENAKCQRPGVCNSMETLLVNRSIAPAFLPRIAEHLQAAGVELRGDEASLGLVPDMKEATEEDWSEEYLDLILSIAIVDDVKAAIEHINRYGSKHSDAIITKDERAQKCFMQQVDASTVYVNASTRFTDGNEFGLGAEMGISTDKLHARGPMGLEELTTYKYQVFGTGQIR
jgi:glutamate-5-semialdehyde dehydrogenase